jgi:hypothetical protein
MSSFDTIKAGDEVYMIDVILRRCQLVHNLATNGLDVMPLDAEEENKQYRSIGQKNIAILAMIDKLNQIIEGST